MRPSINVGSRSERNAVIAGGKRLKNAQKVRLICKFFSHRSGLTPLSATYAARDDGVPSRRQIFSLELTFN
jgi:hypothetical protein